MSELGVLGAMKIIMCFLIAGVLLLCFFLVLLFVAIVFIRVKRAYKNEM